LDEKGGWGEDEEKFKSERAKIPGYDLAFSSFIFSLVATLIDILASKTRILINASTHNTLCCKPTNLC
jgi:hypothetical protein